jgi:hypothetical protein
MFALRGSQQSAGSIETFPEFSGETHNKEPALQVGVRGIQDRREK